MNLPASQRALPWRNENFHFHTYTRILPWGLSLVSLASAFISSGIFFDRFSFYHKTSEWTCALPFDTNSMYYQCLTWLGIAEEPSEEALTNPSSSSLTVTVDFPSICKLASGICALLSVAINIGNLNYLDSRHHLFDFYYSQKRKERKELEDLYEGAEEEDMDGSVTPRNNEEEDVLVYSEGRDMFECLSATICGMERSIIWWWEGRKLDLDEFRAFQGMET